MRTSKIKAKLGRGEPVLVTALALTDPTVFELTSLMGFDGIWLDLEHHALSVETAAGLIRATRPGTSDVMARPAKGELMRLGRLLEAGAQGIMYPRCEGAAEAREVVKWSKFAPLGKRGLDSGNADNPYCATPIEAYVREANEQTFVVVQIEDPEMLGEVDAIAEVEGVDVLFLGPADYSLLSGEPGRFDGEGVREAIRRVARAAEGAGKAWGMPTPSPERTRQLLDMGARFVTHGADILMVKRALEVLREEYGTIGFTFDGLF